MGFAGKTLEKGGRKTNKNSAANAGVSMRWVSIQGRVCV